MGKSAPAPPDFEGAAREQGQASKDAINAQTIANRPNIFMPDGSSVTWNRTGGAVDPAAQQQWQQGYDQNYQKALLNYQTLPPGMREQAAAKLAEQWSGAKPTAGPDSWEMHTNLSPAAQAALEAQQRITQGRSGLAEDLLGRAKSELGTPMDWDSLPQVGSGMDARQRAEDAIMSRQTSRLDPMWQQRESAMQQQLANQGVDVGSEAWRNTYGDFNRGRNDAYQTAMDQSIIGGGQEMSRQFGMDSQARAQALSEMMGRRGQSLNEINALLSGQQVAMPQAPGFMGAGAAQPANIFGAANAMGQYGLQDAASQNAMWGDIFGGLGSLGGGLFNFFKK